MCGDTGELPAFKIEYMRQDVHGKYSNRERVAIFNRLNKLADYLATLPARNYHHDSIVKKCNLEHPCKTVACAFGHAVASGIFHGLRHLKMTEDGIRRRGRHDAYYGSVNDESEADIFFGVGTWTYIFGVYEYGTRDPTKAEVIYRIRQVAKEVFKP